MHIWEPISIFICIKSDSYDEIIIWKMATIRASIEQAMRGECKLMFVHWHARIFRLHLNLKEQVSKLLWIIIPSLSKKCFGRLFSLVGYANVQSSIFYSFFQGTTIFFVIGIFTFFREIIWLLQSYFFQNLLKFTVFCKIVI